MSDVVIGVDPSSRKLAAVVSIIGQEIDAQPVTRALPQDKPVACLTAYEWMKTLVTEHLDSGPVYVYIELPVFGRGGPGSTIPQAQVNGALQAGAQQAGAIVISVNNSHVKKATVGKGNASKDEITQWVSVVWPELHERIENDQDLHDSAMIYVYGRSDVLRRNKIAKNRAKGSVVIRRKKTKA
jgi:Holliday junction resolvasome RuvABC endonuclease subunit